ncbi:unnamed protein product [Choristocarpus tenellus]
MDFLRAELGLYTARWRERRSGEDGSGEGKEEGAVKRGAEDEVGWTVRGGLATAPTCNISSGGVSWSERLGMLPRQCPEWSEMWGQASTSIGVRGKTYLSDKVKHLSKEPLAHVVRCDLFKVERRTDDIIRRLHGTDLDVVDALGSEAELLVLNFQLPGTQNLSFVVYFAFVEGVALQDTKEFTLPSTKSAPDASTDMRGLIKVVGGEAEDGGEGPTDIPVGCLNLVRRFLSAEDKEFCDSRFKIIPSIVDGPWAVQAAVGNTPALMGKKVTQRYFRGENYLEISVDIGSSMLANKLFSLVKSCSVYAVLDMSFVVQGECKEELPERILGGVRLSNVNLEVAVDLPSPVVPPAGHC